MTQIPSKTKSDQRAQLVEGTVRLALVTAAHVGIMLLFSILGRGVPNIPLGIRCGFFFLVVFILFICSLCTVRQANCACIMQHESSANANAMHQNADGHLDVGLW